MSAKNIKNLNNLLANIAVLNIKTYNMHWNVRGENFMTFHKMTEALYEGLTEFMDEIAEKIVMLDGKAQGTMAEYIKTSKVKEVKAKNFTPQEIAKSVVADLDLVEKETLKVEGTPEVQPLLDEIYMFISKQRWFFRKSIK